MLRNCVLALACLAIVNGGTAQAEAQKSTPEAAATAGSSPAHPAPAAPTTVAKAEESAEPSPPATIASPEPVDSEKPAASEPAQPVEAAKPAALPEPTLKAAIDLGAQNITISEHGNVIHSWPISSGTASHPTPRGTFRPQWTAKMWYSRKYDNAPMPNAVFINGGVAIHATYATGMLGRPASHGCIRLAPANAKTFYGLVHKHGLKSVRVSVYGTPKWGSPAIARNNANAKRRYASAEQTDSWSFWGGSSYSKPKPAYKPTSANDPRFLKAQKRAAPVYYYSQSTGQVYVRKSQGARIVYQRAPRKVYYNGYGYGSSNW